ncbi:hypothetical protein NL676_013819 [Syzygium grande]|nr:hypothetical protein NL676_013819 [Syzygium grande]
MNLSVSNIVCDNRHMLLGLSDGSLYGISWKGEFCGAVGLDHPIRNKSDKVTDLPHPISNGIGYSLHREMEMMFMETRKAELETNLATNLKRQKQEYEAIISSSETDLHENEPESKWQELRDTKSLVIDATQQLEGGNFGLIGILLS